jgi:Zn-dependent protease
VDLDVTRVLLAFTVLILSLTIHEAAHAFSADVLGDPTARQLGRVSLNPMVHIDPIGTVLFPLLSLFSPVPLIGWAKPVPVNIRNLHGNWQQKFMLIAAAGPASNLLLAVIAAIGVRMIGFEGGAIASTQQIFRFLLLMATTNVALAVFNMLPVPPLDGGNVLTGLLRGPAAEAFNRLRPYGMFILYGLLLTGVLWDIVDPIITTILDTLL